MIPTRIVPCTLIASMGVDRRQLVAAQMLARAGSTQVHLGLHYERGTGVARGYAESVKWYRMAAEQGHVLGLRLGG